MITTQRTIDSTGLSLAGNLFTIKYANPATARTDTIMIKIEVILEFFLIRLLTNLQKFFNHESNKLRISAKNYWALFP
jgi:hypothetical protein